jgi:hypothetical protein
MGDRDLKFRTKEYALGIIRLFSELPKRTEVQILGRQLFRSGISVGRNTARRRGVNRPRTSSARSRDRYRNWKRANIGSNCSPSQDFTRRKDCLLALKKETGELKGISFSLVGSCSNGYYSRFVIRTPRSFAFS